LLLVFKCGAVLQLRGVAPSGRLQLTQTRKRTTRMKMRMSEKSQDRVLHTTGHATGGVACKAGFLMFLWLRLLHTSVPDGNGADISRP
jgi:hypothetical protein